MLAQPWIGSSRSLILSVTLAVQVRCTLIQRAHRLTGTRRTEHSAGGRWSRVIRYSPGSMNSTPLAPSCSPKYERRGHSLTASGSESSSETFSRHIRRRDGGKCVITGLRNSLIASHLIPKRMGSDGAKDTVTRFSGAQAALDIHRFDTRMGILLFSSLDTLVDHYQLGFYHVTVSYHIEFVILLSILPPHRAILILFITLTPNALICQSSARLLM
jgi:hypothetical protein